MITIVSIAGCCMLLIIGFSLKSSFDGVIGRQFDEIISYDMTVRYLPDRAETAEEEFREQMFAEEAEFSALYQYNTVFRVGEVRETAKIICADPDALMRFYSLTDIKKNTAMRINGFTIRETVGYILRENVITTVIGIALGLVIGNLAAAYNLHTVERVELMMIREISLTSCLYSVLITLIFAVIVNFLALRTIRKLNLKDVND